MYLAFDTGMWGWPQWIVGILYVLVIVLSAFLHGYKRVGQHSFPATLVTSAIGIFLLTAGGFFG